MTAPLSPFALAMSKLREDVKRRHISQMQYGSPEWCAEWDRINFGPRDDRDSIQRDYDRCGSRQNYEWGE